MSKNKVTNENINLDGKAYPYIENKDIIEIQIIADGNCFYRCLSQEIDLTQENYKYYRSLMYNYIMQNKVELKNFFFKKKQNRQKITI